MGVKVLPDPVYLFIFLCLHARQQKGDGNGGAVMHVSYDSIIHIYDLMIQVSALEDGNACRLILLKSLCGISTDSFPLFQSFKSRQTKPLGEHRVQSCTGGSWTR